MCNLATSAVKEEGSGEGKSIMSRTQKTKGAQEGREPHSVPASAWSFFFFFLLITWEMAC